MVGYGGDGANVGDATTYIREWQTWSSLFIILNPTHTQLVWDLCVCVCVSILYRPFDTLGWPLCNVSSFRNRTIEKESETPKIFERENECYYNRPCYWLIYYYYYYMSMGDREYNLTKIATTTIWNSDVNKLEKLLALMPQTRYCYSVRWCCGCYGISVVWANVICCGSSARVLVRVNVYEFVLRSVLLLEVFPYGFDLFPRDFHHPSIK